jgi:hypothetical protein
MQDTTATVPHTHWDEDAVEIVGRVKNLAVLIFAKRSKIHETRIFALSVFNKKTLTKQYIFLPKLLQIETKSFFKKWDRR